MISSRPAIIRRLVVLPQPDGPTRTMNSPSLMARLRSSTARTSPYFLVTCSNVTVAMRAPHSTGASRVLASSRRAAVVDGPRTRSRLEWGRSNTSGCRAWTTLDCVAGCGPRSRTLKRARSGPCRRLASVAHARRTQSRDERSHAAEAHPRTRTRREQAGGRTGQTSGVVIVITGPIACGKSTIASGIGAPTRGRRRPRGRSRSRPRSRSAHRERRPARRRRLDAGTSRRGAAAGDLSGDGVLVIAEGSFNFPSDREAFSERLGPLADPRGSCTLPGLVRRGSCVAPSEIRLGAGHAILAS